MTTLGHDGLGRRDYLDDPNMGPTTFVWNGFGEVVQEVDALLVPRVSTYDELGRVETVSDADGTKTFEWDTEAHGTGKLARSSSADDVATTFAYDSRGLVESVTWTHGASQATQESYTMDFVHDALGRIDEVRYPEVPGRERFMLQQVYDVATGELLRRNDVTHPQAPALLWQVDERTLDGALQRATYGAGAANIALQRGYDPATGRLEHIDMRPAGAADAAYAMAYGYTAAGAVDDRTDEVAERKETFGYDASDRLTSWNVESLTGAFGPRHTDYAFDDVGNLETVTENGVVTDTMTYGWGGKPHALATKNGQAYTYDAKGRQINGPERTIAFGAHDLPKLVQTQGSLGTTTTYSYDATGTRVRKTTASEETTYVGGLYEKRRALVNGPHTEHVFYVPGEGAVALSVVYDEGSGNEQRLVMAEDALGTVSAVLDDTGVVSEQRYYDPYGGKVQVDGAAVPWAGPGGALSDVRRGFTGHEEDAESGLTNMRGRMYDPGQRRFVTPDPFVNEPLWGQGLNRYAYVSNNPLRWVDPSGFAGTATLGPETKADDGTVTVPITITSDGVDDDEDIYDSLDAGDNPTTPQNADETGTTTPSPTQAAPATGPQTTPQTTTPPVPPPTPPPPPVDPPSEWAQRLTIASKWLEKANHYAEVYVPYNGPGPLVKEVGRQVTGEKNTKFEIGVDVVTVVVSWRAVAADKAAQEAARKAAAVLAEEMTAARGGAGVVRIGQAGEAAVRAAADIGPKIPINVGAGRMRIPDGLDLGAKVLSEVKNVSSLSYTRQLRDFAAYASANGLRFDLWVRPTTELSGPLAEEVAKGAINLRFIP